ncbi:MAG: iron ABC transporter permease [Gemmatimonadaceae bacterium]|jgi:iron complex transport system permease protein|nr:iron ABC transporter permease [Gemmatimonadaceae bacterium]
MTASVPLPFARTTARRTPGDDIAVVRRRRARWLPWLLAVLLLVVMVASLATGAVTVAPGDVLRVLAGASDTVTPLDATIVRDIRLPRLILGALVGAALAVGGCALQALFRNPLADPGLVGVSSGAAFATALFLIAPGLLGVSAPPFVFAPWVAFVGGVGVTWLVLRLAQSGGATPVARLILVGVAVNAVASAGTGMLSVVATDAQLRSLSLWLLGSLGGATWRALGVAVGPIVLALVLLLRERRTLDLLLFGEREAAHLGLSVPAATRRLVLAAALGVGGAVAVTGMIGFVGLLVPHAVRLVLGPHHRTLVPSALLLGATLVPAADLLARTVVAPIELPIGAMMALAGGPAFLALVARTRGLAT